MPRWARRMFLGMGAGSAALGVFLATACARWARTDVARVEGLPVVISVQDQPDGAEVVLEGTIGPKPPAYRNFVAFAWEVMEPRDGQEAWWPDGGQTPPLALEGGAQIAAGYRVGRGHVTEDESTGFNGQVREGTRRYHALVAGGPVTAVGTVGGGEFAAAEVFGGRRDEFLASRRTGAGVLPWLGGAFVAVGAALVGVGVLTRSGAASHARRATALWF